MTTIYGISNCDTVRKARKWLEAAGVEFTFHDFRKDGLSKAAVAQWADAVGWETLLNKRGQTWRKLDESDREDLDPSKAIELMTKEPTLIKRPVLVQDQQIEVGFKAERYQELFS